MAETIKAQFNQTRRGIIRRISTESSDGAIRIRLFAGTDESGRSRKHKVSVERGWLSIRIGDPARWIRGEHTYRIKYSVRGAVLGGPSEREQLNWNVTGNEWDAPIAKATASVRFPVAIPKEALVLRAFNGRHGQRDFAGTSEAADGVPIVAVSGLGVREGLTVSVAWPSVTLPHASFVEGILSAAEDVWLGLLAVCLGIVAIVSWWHRHRRFAATMLQTSGTAEAAAQLNMQCGPHRTADFRSRIPRDSPPDDLSPVELGTLIDGETDLHDVVAQIPYLAKQGYIKVAVDDDDELTFAPGPKYEQREELVKHDLELVNARALATLGPCARAGQTDTRGSHTRPLRQLRRRWDTAAPEALVGRARSKRTNRQRGEA